MWLTRYEKRDTLQRNSCGIPTRKKRQVDTCRRDNRREVNAVIYTWRLVHSGTHIASERARDWPVVNQYRFHKRRILSISILVCGSKASTSPSISCSWQVLHSTVLPIVNQSFEAAIFDCHTLIHVLVYTALCTILFYGRCLWT